MRPDCNWNFAISCLPVLLVLQSESISNVYLFIILSIYRPTILLTLEYTFLSPDKTVTSMLVTDIGDEVCWWQLWDVDDRFGHFRHRYLLFGDIILIFWHKDWAPRFKRCHQYRNSDTNIKKCHQHHCHR